MKNLICTIAIVASGFLPNVIDAQAPVCTWCIANTTIQPAWGPAGYDFVDYYYFPDIDVYYNVPNQKFVFEQRGVWQSKSSLPVRYAGFYLYRAYNVVINNVEPCLELEENRIKYVSIKGMHNKVAIRDSRDHVYVKTSELAEHSK